MKKMLVSVALAAAALALFAPVSKARDMGPQRSSSNISASNSVAAIPIGDTGRFVPQWMLFRSIPAGCTQTVKYVTGGITSTYATTTASILAISNVPTMFYGDKFLIETSATVATNTPIVATPIGTVFD